MPIIPFIYSNPGQREGHKGVEISLLGNTNSVKNGFDSIQYDASGLRLAGIGNLSMAFKGVEIAGLFNSTEDDLKGVSIAIGASLVGEELTGFSYGTLVNYARTNGRFSFQIGVFNIIKEYNPEGTVVQLGLYNRVGNQSIPLLNIRRRKNSKKKLEDRI